VSGHVVTKELIVLNHENIRNASFSLLPTGYNPEQVDAALNAVAEKLAAGEDIGELLSTASFQATDVGYAPAEVDAFFSGIAAEAARQTDAQAPAEDEPVAADEPQQAELVEASDQIEDELPQAEIEEEPHAAAAVEDDAEIDDVVEIESASEQEIAHVQAPATIVFEAPAIGVFDLDVLGEAVDRTADTLASLRSFIDNEIGAMKLAVERQAQETVKRCEQLLHDASAEASALTASVNEDISRARAAAEQQNEKQRRDLAKELKQALAACDAEVAQARAAAEEYAAKVRAEADRDRAEAQRTIENAISMQSSIAESLERARQQLTPSPAASDELAA
jgi:DivIVA domain-containing protein